MQDQQIRVITNNIRKQREKLSYSQEYMAMKMEISQNCYSKIELGNSKLTVERLLAICKILDLEATSVLSNGKRYQETTTRHHA